ncbi:hypothetical protein L596_028287 [Steinernema carpocapsae]|uniref:Uncharacterized protein n=1 Tax=Steinernema carpocapsae TaxID=34508 RepID=A0A4U5LXZ0_STECR|nr:hypothetical protein L596_028287 [Steinernema carpocapsae]
MSGLDMLNVSPDLSMSGLYMLNWIYRMSFHCRPLCRSIELLVLSAASPSTFPALRGKSVLLQMLQS